MDTDPVKTFLLKRTVLILGLLLCITLGVIIVIPLVSSRHPSQATVVNTESAPEPILTDEETIGQIFIWGIPGKTLSSESANLIANTHPAGVILMGDFTWQELHSMTKEIQKITTTLPLFIAIDQEGGTVKRVTDDGTPGGRILGLLNEKDFCDAIASRSALLTTSGVNLNLGIVGDVGWTQHDYMWNRTYGDMPNSVAERVARAIRCLPDSISVVKHFPGHGSTQTNSHYSVPLVDKDELTWRLEDGLPFLRAIKENVDMIMIGHIRYEKIASEPASLSKTFHRIIKDEGFTGLILTDDLGMLEQSGYKPHETLRKAIEAGNDLILITASSVSPLDLYTNLVREATQTPELMKTIRSHVNSVRNFKMKHLSF